MAKMCKEAATKAVSISKGQVKVRLLGVTTPRGMDRLEPLRQHFEQMVEQVIAQCPNVCLVQHVEAMTAKEESLLLLLGDVGLAGGRGFMPRADCLLEAELVETDARGKTFDDTTIEIRFRLGSGSGGEWTKLSGKVADWPKLAPQACQSLAEQLGAAKPEAAAQYATEMIARRRQAEAELKAARPPRGRGGHIDLDRVATAVKLDPTYEDAAYELASRQNWGFDETNVKTWIPEALRYVERFPPKWPPGNWREVMGNLSGYCVMSESQNLPDVGTLRKIVELGLMNDNPFTLYCNCPALVEKVYRRWLAEGGDPAECKQWLERIRQRVDYWTPLVAADVDTHDHPHTEGCFLEFRSFLVNLAVESGDSTEARLRLSEFMAQPRWTSLAGGAGAKQLRNTVAKMGDPQLLADYDRWLVKLTTPVEPIKLVSDDYPVYEGTAPVDKTELFSPMLPLTASPTAIYGVVGPSGLNFPSPFDRDTRRGEPERLASIALDANKRPTGDVTLLALPSLKEEPVFTCAIPRRNTLCGHEAKRFVGLQRGRWCVEADHARTRASRLVGVFSISF